MEEKEFNIRQLKVVRKIFADDLIDRILDLKENEFSKQLRLQNSILRFTPDFSYSTGNFSRLRGQHGKLQLDSVNKTNDRFNTILKRTNWPKEFFKNKLVLECGCGAGADTEILRKLGAIVVSVDIAGLDVCKDNVGETDQNGSLIIQADITNLPFKKEAFDIVWCHRVLQHTPNPNKTLEHILKFVKPDGSVFVHSYSRSFLQLFNWKYFLRPITKRMNDETLYRFVKWYTPFILFNLQIRRVKPDILGKIFF